MSFRVVVVDDHPVVRAGIVMLLGLDPDIEVVGEAADGSEAAELVAQLDPDVVLTDLQMPGLDGVELTKRLMREKCRARVLVLTTYDTDRLIVAAVDAGAAGYILKDTPAPELIDAVKAVASGSVVLPNEVAEKLAASRNQPTVEDLTSRELEVLGCVARGLSNAATAGELFISVATVKTHLIHVFQKLQVDDRTAAVTKALRLGILEPPS